jgi:hypothetical protein
MNLHPGLEQRQESEVKRAESDPIFRALQENEDWYQDLVGTARTCYAFTT